LQHTHARTWTTLALASSSVVLLLRFKMIEEAKGCDAEEDCDGRAESEPEKEGDVFAAGETRADHGDDGHAYASEAERFREVFTFRDQA